MTRAANLFHYCSSRAYTSSEDLKDGARRLFGIAYELIWAPVTVPKAAISYGLSFPLTRALVLLPLQFVQRTRSGGKVITFTLVDATGRATNTQPVWAQWNYDVAGLLELLEKHLQLQHKQVWIECLGVTQKGIFKDTYTILPPTTTVKDFALPLTSIVAFVESHPSAAADAVLASTGPATHAITPDASPEKAGRSSKEFFILPADARSGPQSLLLASHPLPTNMSDSHSDADSPLGSPVSASNRPPFSPFTEVMGGPRWI